MPTPHVFAGNPLNRGEQERRDEEWIRSQGRNSTSKFLPLWDPRVLISDGNQPDGNQPDGYHPVGYHPELGWLDLSTLAAAGFDWDPLFLGLQHETAHFAVDLSRKAEVGERLQENGKYRFEDARSAAEMLSTPEAGILAQGRAQINWHNRHVFCSVCGHETEVRRGGQKRECPHCKAEHFPRVDPVIIMVVSDQERCLLGQSRGRLAAMNRYSALAGFLDQGESIEEGVAREVMEEAGIKVKNVRYHSSQPWPFPSSLMIGCHADAATTEIAMDAEEMTDVKWFDREEVLLALEEKSEKLMLPGRIAIAHHLIRAWAHQEID